SGENAISAEPLLRTIGEHFLQCAAMNRILRIVVTGVAPERLPINQLPETVEEHRFAREHGHARKRRFESKLRERSRSVRQNVDAKAKRPDLRRGAVDPASGAGAVR